MIKDKKIKTLMKYLFNLKFLCEDLVIKFKSKSKAKEYIKKISDERDRLFQEINATLWIMVLLLGMFFNIPFFVYGFLFLLFYIVNNGIIKKDTLLVNSDEFIDNIISSDKEEK